MKPDSESILLYDYSDRYLHNEKHGWTSRWVSSISELKACPACTAALFKTASWKPLTLIYFFMMLFDIELNMAWAASPFTKKLHSENKSFKTACEIAFAMAIAT